MPVRSLNSAVFKWPTREAVLAAARVWAAALRQRDPTVQRVACIGSAARGDWGVGSDLDLILILSDTTLSPEARYRQYYPDGLPVPVDLWVYTRVEWEGLATRAPLLWRRLSRELLHIDGSTGGC